MMEDIHEFQADQGARLIKEIRSILEIITRPFEEVTEISVRLNSLFKEGLK